MSFFTVQKMLAVTPIQRQGIKTVIKNGIAIMSQSTSTVTVELLFDALIDGEFVLKGSKVAFLGDAEAKPWNAKVYTHDGVDFVLAPYSDAVLIQSPQDNQE